MVPPTSSSIRVHEACLSVTCVNSYSFASSERPNSAAAARTSRVAASRGLHSFAMVRSLTANFANLSSNLNKYGLLYKPKLPKTSDLTPLRRGNRPFDQLCRPTRSW